MVVDERDGAGFRRTSRPRRWPRAVEDQEPGVELIPSGVRVASLAPPRSTHAGDETSGTTTLRAFTSSRRVGMICTRHWRQCRRPIGNITSFATTGCRSVARRMELRACGKRCSAATIVECPCNGMKCAPDMLAPDVWSCREMWLWGYNVDVNAQKERCGRTCVPRTPFVGKAEQKYDDCYSFMGRAQLFLRTGACLIERLRSGRVRPVADTMQW